MEEKYNKVAKNLLLNRVCYNCTKRSIVIKVHCPPYKENGEFPSSNTCEHFVLNYGGALKGVI